MSDLRIRAVTSADATAIAAIYAPYVADSVITFEETVPSVDEMATRIAAVSVNGPYLVAERAGAVIGYAYAGSFHPRSAYRWTCETTVYLAMDARGAGVGRPLYAALIEAAAARRFVTAAALITLPNEASTKLHERLGFRLAGRLDRVGFKNGQWHDVGYYQRDLAPRTATPAEPLRG